MSDQTMESLKSELKEMIIQTCNLGEENITADQISDDGPLIDPAAPLGIDSLDALEIVIALEKKYGVRIRDINTSRKILKSVNTIADFVRKESSSF